MSEWFAPGLVLLSFAAFSVAVAYMAFSKGVEMGKQLGNIPTARSPRKPLTSADTIALQLQLAKSACVECGIEDGKHHPDCPLDPSKNRPRNGRRWKGFSALKRDLENKESA